MLFLTVFAFEHCKLFLSVRFEKYDHHPKVVCILSFLTRSQLWGEKGRVGLTNTRRNLSFVRRLWRLSMDGKWWHGVMGHGTMGHSHNIDGKQILFPARFERQFVAAAAAMDGLGTNLVKII